jgi:hypothetical protein
MSLPADSALMNWAIRMVVPMKREFGLALDVQQFLRDRPYAQSLIDVALGSRDPRLVEYAQHVQRHFSGARMADPPKVDPTAAAPQAQAATPAPGGEPTEAELRQRMLKKYTGGLR